MLPQLGNVAMSQTPGVSINSAISQTEKLISRQRTVILERTARGKPIEALSPVLNQIEGNLRLLNKVQQFIAAQHRRMPGI